MSAATYNEIDGINAIFKDLIKKLDSKALEVTTSREDQIYHVLNNILKSISSYDVKEQREILEKTFTFIEMKSINKNHYTLPTEVEQCIEFCHSFGYKDPGKYFLTALKHKNIFIKYKSVKGSTEFKPYEGPSEEEKWKKLDTKLTMCWYELDGPDRMKRYLNNYKVLCKKGDYDFESTKGKSDIEKWLALVQVRDVNLDIESSTPLLDHFMTFLKKSKKELVMKTEQEITQGENISSEGFVASSEDFDPTVANKVVNIVNRFTKKLEPQKEDLFCKKVKDAEPESGVDKEQIHSLLVNDVYVALLDQMTNIQERNSTGDLAPELNGLIEALNVIQELKRIDYPSTPQE